MARSQSHSTLSCGGAPLDVIKQSSSSKLALMTNRLSEPVAIASNQIKSDGAAYMSLRDGPIWREPPAHWVAVSALGRDAPLGDQRAFLSRLCRPSVRWLRVPASPDQRSFQARDLRNTTQQIL